MDRGPVRRAVSPALVGALVGAVLGTAGTLAVVRTTPAYQGGPTVTSPVVEAVGEGGLNVVQAVARAVAPSVVRVDIVERRRDPADPASTLEAEVGNGSGVIYRSDGFIITNNHVVIGGDRLRVRLSSGERLDARVVGTDPVNDLAVLKVDRTGLPAITVRQELPVEVGEVAVAIGSPFGLDTTVTAGVVSATNRTIDVPDPASGRPLVIPNVLQTDAAINPGNSGGALVDASGRLIGINTAIFSATGGNEGVGFAIAAAEAIAVADELIEHGFVEHALLGVTGVDLTPSVAEELGLEVDGGAVVDAVEPGSGAAEAGLQPDDIIIAVDGEPLRSMTQLVVVIRQHRVGDVLELTIVRDGRRERVEVELGERPR
ncbi:MAG: trypsin-like peptidase domain-containing protein [Actinobacteria bacterium]|nr:trypsin-like peptidase domain-containing protein [Actinomycetota bacterium]